MLCYLVKGRMIMVAWWLCWMDENNNSSSLFFCDEEWAMECSSKCQRDSQMISLPFCAMLWLWLTLNWWTTFEKFELWHCYGVSSKKGTTGMRLCAFYMWERNFCSPILGEWRKGKPKPPLDQIAICADVIFFNLIIAPSSCLDDGFRPEDSSRCHPSTTIVSRHILSLVSWWPLSWYFWCCWNLWTLPPINPWWFLFHPKWILYVRIRLYLLLLIQDIFSPQSHRFLSQFQFRETCIWTSYCQGWFHCFANLRIVHLEGWSIWVPVFEMRTRPFPCWIRANGKPSWRMEMRIKDSRWKNGFPIPKSTPKWPILPPIPLQVCWNSTVLITTLICSRLILIRLIATWWTACCKRYDHPSLSWKSMSSFPPLFDSPFCLMPKNNIRLIRNSGAMSTDVRLPIKYMT